VSFSMKYLPLRIITTLVALVAVAITAILPTAAAAQTAQRCFPETGFCISGPIRRYWERNGGLAVFGFPISAQRTETVEGSWTGPVQWFERDRLEDHWNDGQGVLAGRLGARALELQGINWQTLPGDDAAIAGCRFFRETQFNLCEPFLSYWQNNGGLARFGYPLTRQRQEVLQGREYTVQYFERRRMELHPENAGTPYEVLLGLLGHDVYAAEGDANVVAVAPGDIDGSVQQAILDTAYASLRARGERAKLAIGLVEVEGDRAVALARPFGKAAVTLALARRNGTWQVVPATETPGGNLYTTIDLALAQLQLLSGSGINAYVTRPRVSGDFARVWFAAGASENIDSVSAFFKRSGNRWSFLTAGSAFPEDDLRRLGVPQELWPIGATVRGPAS
jgi:hypothetical protein